VGRGGRDRADRRLEMATRSDNRGLSQSFRATGAHEQADPGAHPDEEGSPLRRWQYVARQVGRLPRHWRPPKKRPRRRGAN
jgi:hypothetical protein